MLSDPDKLQQEVDAFWVRLRKLGKHATVDSALKLVEPMRDTFAKGDPDPLAWRALMAMYVAGRVAGSYVQDCERIRRIEAMEAVLSGEASKWPRDEDDD